MSLKSRLSRLQSQAGSKPTPTPPSPHAEAMGSLSRRLAHLRPERIQGLKPSGVGRMEDKDLAATVNGELISDGLIRISASVSLTESVGETPLSGLNDTQLLPGEMRTLPCIYIDTETTGLSGGSGTLAFLVGIAVVTESEIRLTQLLMTRFTAETALLTELKGLLPDNHRLVSYNGKSFDLPLLTTRFRMQGLSPGLAEREHLDLLHPVRRLFGKRWDDCRLTTVERNLLGFSRKDDLPGSEAPEAWFAYVRAGYGEQLVKIVEHNRQDILSLASLHYALARAVEDPERHDVDLHALARWWSESDEARAIGLLRHHRGTLCADGKRLLAYLLRRQEQWLEAVPLWDELAQAGCTESIERLAKYHEHISKDLVVALSYCERLPGSRADRHRKQRILKKLRENGGNGLFVCA